MATIKTLNPQTSSLSDVIAALADTNLSAEAKVQVMTQAADPAKLTRICIYLNHYFADSQDAYVDDADAAIAAAEEAERRAKAKAEAEVQEKARRNRAMNAAAKNLALRGVEIFKDGELNPDYQKALNLEIGKLLKGDRLYMTEAGEFFVPDSSRSNLSPEQIAALDKAEIEDEKSDDVIDLEDTRPMKDGPHEVTISFYKEKNGRNGKPNYAVIQVEELNTGKQVWLPSWMLVSPKKVDRRDAWRTRYMMLKTIAINNKGLGERMTEEQMVELLHKAPFTIYTYQENDQTRVFIDPEQYKKFVTKRRIAKELAEERENRERELNAMGLDPDKVEQNESIEAKSYKF